MDLALKILSLNCQNQCKDVTVETDDASAETLGEDGSDAQAAADTASTTY